MDTIAKMHDIAKRYINVSGLHDRRFYSIFFSRIDPADALILGIKPGGDTASWSESELASRSFYENWEHEYVDCSYPIQRTMLPFLMQVFDIDKESVRKLPKSNLSFRRAKTVDSFKDEQGMTLEEAQLEAMPFVEEIIAHVSPKIIILEGITAFNFFCANYGQSVSGKSAKPPIFTLHNGKQVRIFCESTLHVGCLGREIPIVGIGHPSYFGSKPEWKAVTQRTKEIVAEFRGNAHQKGSLVILESGAAGKASLSLQQHGTLIIRV